MQKKNLLTLLDWTPGEVRELISLSLELKKAALAGELERPFVGKTLALLFEKASMRTRVSFEVAMFQLGGCTVYLSKQDVNLGGREPVKDGARVLDRYVDAIAARVFSHATVEELGGYAGIPVINALSDEAHPCQALADVLTIQERFGDPAGRTVTFVGDANNVAFSLAVACAYLGVNFRIAAPDDYAFPGEKLVQLQSLAAKGGAQFEMFVDPREAARGADVLYTDVWVSMGQEAQVEARRSAFAAYCINDELLNLAAPSAIVMHCLPAHRGEEITESVIEGRRSAVFDQAENRLHAQRGLLYKLMS